MLERSVRRTTGARYKTNGKLRTRGGIEITEVSDTVDEHRGKVIKSRTYLAGPFEISNCLMSVGGN